MSSRARSTSDPSSLQPTGVAQVGWSSRPPALAHSSTVKPATPKFAPFAQWVTRLTRQHARRLALVARSEGLDGSEALDAVQDALLTFTSYADAQGLEGDDEGGSKLLTAMVRNAARNARRRHHRARPHDSWDDEAPASAESSSTEDLVARAELHVLLGGCLDTLNRVQRDVVTLRMLEELSGEEVAEQLALESGHVAVLLYRAKKSLARCLTEH